MLKLRIKNMFPFVSKRLNIHQPDSFCQKMGAFLTFMFALGVICLQQQIIKGDSSKISPELSSLLEKGQRANVIVSFIGGIQPALDRARAQRHTDRKPEIQAIVEATKEHAAKSQAGVISTLSSRSAAGGDFKYFKQFWVGNKLFVKEANAETVKVIAKDPKVSTITKEPIAQVPVEEEATNYGLPDSVPRPIWNIERLQVQKAWEELGGKKGDGVVVGTIDSGARHTHEALRDNFVGLEYGWYDAINYGAEPFDHTGHGTHVLGTLAGGQGIGIAPNAKWMSCNVSPGNASFPGEALLECIQWMACPTLFDGTNPNCSKAPAIVSNSWAVPRGANDFNESILHLRAMGIIPVFAVGNEGIRCNKTRAPGELPFVIGVGASNEKEAWFHISAVGPASDGNIKPDLVAPGDAIWSAYHTGDSLYYKRHGTSMATPHVSGVVGLLKVRNPSLTYDEAYDLLTQNTAPMEWKPLPGGINASFLCNGGADAKQTPNIYWGHGRVDAFKAVQAQTRLMSAK